MGILDAPPALQTINQNLLTLVRGANVATNINYDEGYTTDGTYHYVSSDSTLGKYDANWNLVASNATPFSFMVGVTTTHIGALQYYNGLIYGGCVVNGTTCYIVAWSASNLAYNSYAANPSSTGIISNSAIAIRPDQGPNGTIYIAYYTTTIASAVIWATYDASTFASLGVFNLSQPLWLVQGIYYREADGLFYVSGDQGQLWAVNTAGTVLGQVISDNTAGEYEDLDWSQSDFRWMTNITTGYSNITSWTEQAITLPFVINKWGNLGIGTATPMAAVHFPSDPPNPGASAQVESVGLGQGIQWGTDYPVNLFYFQRNALRLKDAFLDIIDAGGITDGTGRALGVIHSSVTSHTFVLYNDGHQAWSSGSAAYDVELSRTAPGVLTVAAEGAATAGVLQANILAALGVTGAPDQARLAGATATAGPPTTGTWSVDDLTLDPNGAAWVCTLAGTPGTWVPVNPRANDQLATGISTLDRLYGSTANASVTTGSMRFSYFTATQKVTVSNIKMNTGTTAAGATPTLCQMALYEQTDAAGDLTLLAYCANDTTLFNGTQSSFERALNTSVTLQPGQRYAVAPLVVSTATMPTLGGIVDESLEAWANTPRIAGSLAGQTSLPATVTASSFGRCGYVIYAELL